MQNKTINSVIKDMQTCDDFIYVSNEKIVSHCNSLTEVLSLVASFLVDYFKKNKCSDSEVKALLKIIEKAIFIHRIVEDKEQENE